MAETVVKIENLVKAYELYVEIIADGKPNDIFSKSELLQKAGLALPQTSELLALLKSHGFDVNTGIISPELTAKEIFLALDREANKWVF